MSTARPRAIGIDLGTTHSLIAYVDDHNRPSTIPVDGGSPLLPSAVQYREGDVRVGEEARRDAALRPEETLLSVKRWMGRSPRDLGAADRGIYRFDEAATVVRVLVEGGARAVTPVEVSAEILRVLRRRAEEELGAVGGCVVTVPAYFDDAQRQATRDAARLAGLDVLRLLNEPTAAALAYGLDHRSEGTFAVYDLGGGTFDVSILRLGGGTFEVLATAGDTHLGGDDLDRALAEELLRRSGVAPAPGPLRAVLDASRRVREALSTVDAWEEEVPLPDGAAVAASVRRDELEALIRPIVERTTPACERALRDARVERLDGVVLVGGATRTPLVRRHVRHLFGREPLTDLDPDTVVALGAAVQADALEKGGRDDVLLLDVLPLSLGVEMMGGVVERILLRNSTIPASATQQFTTHADGQTGLVVHVVQGERELARDCRSLARFTLRGIPPLPAGAARVEITYTVDANGILSVAARELGTGVEQRIRVKATYGLSEEDVERMLIESLEHAGEDVERRILAEWKLEASRVVQALEEALRADPELVADAERVDLEARLRGLREAAAGDDPHALRAWLDSVDEASRAFAERRLDKHVGRALAGKRLGDV